MPAYNTTIIQASVLRHAEQVESLKIQHTKAEEGTKNQLEQESIKCKTALKEALSHKNKVEMIERKLEEQNTQLDTYQTLCEQRETEIDSLNNNVGKLVKALEGSVPGEEHESLMHEVETDLHTLKLNNSKLTAQNSEYEGDLNRAAEEVDGMEKELEQSKVDMDTLEEDARVEVARLQVEIDKLTTQSEKSNEGTCIRM